jgi:cellulose synthase-like protein
MNMVVHAPVMLSNGAFMLNFDFDHYIYNYTTLREAMCYIC